MREWILGRNPVYEVLRADRRDTFHLQISKGAGDKGRLKDIIHLATKQRVPITRVERFQIDSLGPNHQGVALNVSAYPYQTIYDILEKASSQDESPFILILDTLQDPQNLGTLLRTAEIVGVHGVLLPLRRTATISPAVVSASSGASEHLLIAQTNLHQGLMKLKDEGIWVVGLDGSPEAEILSQIRLDGPIAFVVGSEGQGMRSLIRKTCDLRMRLPMRGQIDSLNAAVAGSVALYLAWQARGFP
jgi:23S rRNA (guanosine2251-2'-O)-methyltransferase